MQMSNEILQMYTSACRGEETESLELHLGMPPKQQGHMKCMRNLYPLLEEAV